MKSDPLLDELEAAYTGENLILGSRTQVTAITASADGDIALAVIVLVAKGFLGQVGEDLCNKSNAVIHSIYRRLREHYVGGVELEDGDVQIILEDDLPPEAIAQLNEPLPATRTGVLRFDRELGRWIDDGDWYKSRGL
jgi:hypothetical protein